MRKSLTVGAGLVVLAGWMWIAGTASVHAQQSAPPTGGGRSPVAVKKIDGTKVATPVYGVKGVNVAASRGKEWFQVFAEYDTEADWIDELSFTFYVLVKGSTKDVAPFTVFKGETTFIHIPSGRKHTADMFLHPNIIARYGDVERVAVEVRQGGRVVERVGKPSLTEPWWERLSPVEGVLLNRSQSPFALVNIDDQEIIKPK